MTGLSARGRAQGAAVRAVVGVVGVAVAFGLAGGADAAKVKLRVMFKSDTDNVRVAKARIKAFEARYPSIQIVPEYNVSGETPNQRLLLQLASGVAPDVAAIDLEPVELALRKLLLPLDPFVKGDKEFQSWQWMHPRQLDEFRYNGKLYAIPEGLCPYLLYYNGGLFKQAGLPAPPSAIKGSEYSAWTYANFIESGRKLTLDKNGDGKLDMFAFSAWGFSHPDAYTPWVWMSGSDIFKIDAKTGLAKESNLSDPKVVDAIQFYCDLKNRYRIVGGDFNGQKAAMYYAGRWNVPILRQAKLKFDWDVTPMPHPEGREANHLALLRPRGVILSATKHPKEAWTFLRFIAAPAQEQVTWDAQAVFTIPVYKNSVIRDKFLTDAPPRNNQLFIDIGMDDSSKCSWDNKVPKRWAEIWATMGSELAKVWDGKATAAQICVPLEKRLTGIMKR